MSERPMTRREMRERERMEATGQIPRIADPPVNGAPTVAVVTPAEPERTSVKAAAAQVPSAGTSEAPVAEPAAQAPATLTRRALHRPQLGDERSVARRPVAEPTTSTTIPKYGSVPVPIDVPAAEPGEEIAAAEPALEVGNTFEPRAEVSPEPQAVLEIEPQVEVSPEPQAESATSAPEDLVAAIEPEADSEVQVQAVSPGWLPMAEVPAAAPEVNIDAAAPESTPEKHHTDKGLIVRYVMLVAAFFVIGSLLWIFIDGQIGFGASAPAVGITESTALGEFGRQ